MAFKQDVNGNVQKLVRFRWPVRKVSDFMVEIDIPAGDMKMFILNQDALCEKLGLTAVEYDRLHDKVFETIIDEIVIVK